MASANDLLLRSWTRGPDQADGLLYYLRTSTPEGESFSSLRNTSYTQRSPYFFLIFDPRASFCACFSTIHITKAQRTKTNTTMLLDKATFEQKVKGFATRRSQSYTLPPVASTSYGLSILMVITFLVLTCMTEKPARDVVSDSAVSTSGKSTRDMKIERLKQAEIAHLKRKRERQVVDHCKEDRDDRRYIQEESRQIRRDHQDSSLPVTQSITDCSSEISTINTNSPAFRKLSIAAAVASAVTRWRERNRIGRSRSAPLLASSVNSSPNPGRGNFLEPPSHHKRQRSCSGASRTSMSSSLRSGSLSSFVSPV